MESAGSVLAAVQRNPDLQKQHGLSMGWAIYRPDPSCHRACPSQRYGRDELQLEASLAKVMRQRPMVIAGCLEAEGHRGCTGNIYSAANTEGVGIGVKEISA